MYAYVLCDELGKWLLQRKGVEKVPFEFLFSAR